MVGNRYGSNIPSNPVQPTQEDLLMFWRRKSPFPTDISLDAQFDYGQKNPRMLPAVALEDK